MQDHRVQSGIGAATLIALTVGLSGPVRGQDYAGDAADTQPAQRSFYVRGDIGIGRFSDPQFSQEDLAENGGTFLQQSIDDAVYIGFGIGLQASRRLRFDLTGEYRSTADVRAMDTLSAELVGPAGTLQANTIYEGDLQSFVGLFNGYWDLFHARGFTPYVGAGIGFAHNTISDLTTASAATFVDAGGAVTTEFSNGSSKSHSETNLAWALMAGTSYDISSNAKLDLGYRYLNMGSDFTAMTDILECVCGTVGEPLKISELDSHEIRIGIRWALGGPTTSDSGPLK